MLISYKWLQSYFDEQLPEPEKLAERITFSFAEIEGIEKKGDDTILDIKVLPDRACYALSHRGVAYEVAAITGLKKKTVEYPQPEVKKIRPFEMSVEAPDLCPRYTARLVLNVTQKAMPWVKEHLDAMGQRSINPVVDGANLIMFDRGQSLHAFDADKVKGALVVRRAKKGEKMTTLDNREVALDESVLLIADDEGPLGIAGIKGGTRAAVTLETKNLILESASFNASHLRKTSERLGIKTDASKRFENKFSASLADKGMSDFSAYLFEMDSPRRTAFGEIVDCYPNPVKEKKIAITPEYIETKLGMKLSADAIKDVLERLLIKVEKHGNEWQLTPPVWRADLTIPEDISEEVGRIIGYDKIPSVLPVPLRKGGARVGEGGGCEIPKSFYWEWKIRETLVNAGFSEIMTSSFSEKGSEAIEKPLAEDKKYARPDLRSNFEKALKMNVLNAPLFGSDEAKIFEIGRVFTKDGEKTALAIGVAGPKKKIAGVLESAVKEVSKVIGAGVAGETKDGIFECMLDGIFEKLTVSNNWDVSIPSVQNKKFTPFSLYPFITRDVALFVSPLTKGVPESAREGVVFPSVESVGKVIKENAGDLVVRGPSLFDEFTKDGKKSLAFRLVFQSFDRTLSDEEVNKIMEKVYGVLKGKSWEVR